MNSAGSGIIKWRAVSRVEDYLRSCGKRDGVTVGLLLGQSSSDCNDIIHLAKTPEDKHGDTSDSDNASDGEKNLSSAAVHCIDNIMNVSDSSVADHAKHVTRMLPGGMFVLGVFAACDENIFSNSDIFNKVKKIVLHINKTLLLNKYMFGLPPHSDRLIIHFSIKDNKLSCKSIDVGNSSNTPKVVELKFQSNLNHWQQLDCYHEFDEIYPVITKKAGVSVREQFQHILKSASESIESSIIFLDGKLKNNNDFLESLHKKSKNSKQNDNSPRPIQISIFMPCESNLPDTVEYIECEGTTHFSGIVASRIYLSPKATVQDATVAIKQDVIRSLASRFTMHCDALIDDNLLPEEKVCFNEPPRRVLIKLPEFEGNVFLSDYLFPGESPIEALMSVKEMLDADITEEDVICNVETPADTSEFDALERNPSIEEVLNTPQSANQAMYIIVVSITILILLIAIIVQYFM